MEENRFNHSQVYKIVCRVTNLVYIGSTTQELNKRLSDHKSHYNQYLAGKYGYVTSFEIIKNNDYYIKKIKSYNFDNNAELLIKETYWTKKYNCENKNVPNRSKAQYYIDKKVEITEYRVNYYQAKRDEIIAAKKVYYQANKERFGVKCVCVVCGSTYNKRSKSEHEKTKKHIQQI